MSYESILNTLTDVQRLILQLANDNHIDLTELANLQVQKQENDTNLNEVQYGRD